MKEGRDVAVREWFITVSAAKISQDELEESLSRYSAYIGQLERGEKTSHLHFHVLLQNDSPVRFSTLKRLLKDVAHIEPLKGTVEQAILYATKPQGRVGDIFKRGEIKVKQQGRRTDLEAYHRAIVEEGKTAGQVAIKYPRSFIYVRQLQALQHEVEAVKFSKQLRTDLRVSYLFGPPGCGKTSLMYKLYNPADFFRVTDYRNFDGYQNEKVIIFDEWAEQLPLGDMLNYLDIFPVELKSRYRNKWAHYNRAWILSNLPLEQWYLGEAETRRKALRRRIHDFYTADDIPLLTKSAA